MDAPYIRIDKKEYGLQEDGKKITQLGQIYGYENHNGIAVLQVESAEESEIVFMELNLAYMNLTQIMNEEDYKALRALWETVQVVDAVAEKLGLNNNLIN